MYGENYRIINNTLNLLIVEDDPIVSNLIVDFIGHVPIYSIYRVSDLKSAENVLSQMPHVHTCILDLGIVDSYTNDQNLLCRYSSKTSFVIYTGRAEPEKACECILNGAKELVYKFGHGSILKLVRAVNTHALSNVLYPPYRSDKSDEISRIIYLLISTFPRTVSEWAANANMCDRVLRRKCKEEMQIRAKDLIAIYQFYKIAFEYYESTLFGKGRFNTTQSEKNARLMMKLVEYFFNHKTRLLERICQPCLKTMSNAPVISSFPA